MPNMAKLVNNTIKDQKTYDAVKEYVLENRLTVVDGR